MKLEHLKDLYVEELKDIYSAETQLVKALPKMAKAAHSPQLQESFNLHLQQTKGHVERLEQIFEKLGEKPTGKTCKGMAGLITEGEEMMSEKGEPEVIDAGLISAAQRVEHYEIAAYGCARTYARMLGERDAEKILQQTLTEEEATDKKLTVLAESSINVQAKQK
jgi:ferritin-like metal-binding protein YciE